MSYLFNVGISHAVLFFTFVFESNVKVNGLLQQVQDAFFSIDVSSHAIFIKQVVVGVNISCCTGVQVTMPLVAMDTVKRRMENLTANVSRCGDISRERN